MQPTTRARQTCLEPKSPDLGSGPSAAVGSLHLPLTFFSEAPPPAVDVQLPPELLCRVNRCTRGPQRRLRTPPGLPKSEQWASTIFPQCSRLPLFCSLSHMRNLGASLAARTPRTNKCATCCRTRRRGAASWYPLTRNAFQRESLDSHAAGQVLGTLAISSLPSVSRGGRSEDGGSTGQLARLGWGDQSCPTRTGNAAFADVLLPLWQMHIGPTM